MKTRILAVVMAVLLAVAARAAEDKPAASEEKPTAAEGDAQLERRISKLVAQLNDDRAADRDAAEKELLELAGTNTAQSDRFLVALPKDNDQMPLAVRDKLGRIRQQVEDRVAKASTNATTVTLSAKEMPLADVFKEIEKQTGNKLIDNRDEQEGGSGNTKITIELKDEPFWPRDRSDPRSGKARRLQLRRRGSALDRRPRQRRQPAQGPRGLQRSVPPGSLGSSIATQPAQAQCRSRSGCNSSSLGNRGCGRSRYRSLLPM